MRPRAFRLWTEEGSVYIARFDPSEQFPGFGRLNVAGFCKTTSRNIHVKGIGALPETGGQLIIDDQPVESYVQDGEVVPIYPKETICGVAEIPLPDLVSD